MYTGGINCCFATVYITRVYNTFNTWFQSSDTIFGGPFSVRVTAGESAVFTCTVSCTDAITWFATKHPHAARQSVSALTNYTRVVSQCTNDEVYTEALIITTTVDINTTLLQCAAMNFNVCRNAAECKLRPRLCFSRFAEITGKVVCYSLHTLISSLHMLISSLSIVMLSMNRRQLSA